MNNEKVIWDLLIKEGFTPEGVAGMMGNIQAESNGNANNLQGTGNTKLGISDEEFCQALNDGRYAKDTFINDHFGFGICQWTWWGRKQNFYTYMQNHGYKFDDVHGQVEFLTYELRTSYKTCYDKLKSAKTVREAAEFILKNFEKPADQSDAVVTKRTTYGEEIYKRMNTQTVSTTENDNVKKAVELLQQAIKLLS